MPCRRRFALLSPLLLLALPACGGVGNLLPVRPTPLPPAPPRPASEFASLKPGDTISLHAAVEVEKVAVATDPPPKEQPPPKADVPETLPPIGPLALPSALAKAIQAFSDGQPDKEAEHLTAFDKPNQELLLQLIPALVQASRMNLSRPDGEDSQAVARQFETAAAMLAKRAGLGISKAVVCLGVDGYGVYTAVKDKSALRANCPYSLYLELGNVPCLPSVRADGAEGYLTLLECEMRVADDQGGVVEIVDVKTGVPGPSSKKTKSEFTRSPVRDYFVSAVFKTPARPGAYTVAFEVRDPRTGQSVSRTVGFRVQ